MGQKPTEEELFQMISEVDDNMSGSIDFPEFLKVRTAKQTSTPITSIGIYYSRWSNAATFGV